jgi:hypothetical protein
LIFFTFLVSIGQKLSFYRNFGFCRISVLAMHRNFGFQPKVKFRFRSFTGHFQQCHLELCQILGNVHPYYLDATTTFFCPPSFFFPMNDHCHCCSLASLNTRERKTPRKTNIFRTKETPKQTTQNFN